ncbi:hypothetical protein Vretimale_10889 [Volvox reticuliferus]|uniref:Uncharacterized protein n=1 Tax=Volvox reticuliferus TaxID=1737510 RepID=A0A8J4LQD3_9CHLO|nr:hypothetical protein Vretifemale_12640 [Volvox reticuliferus]GIM06643.1 hypothetical protein Vretimale_10889 [Volvox reticuliferus]
MDEEIPYNELLLDVEDGIVVGLYHYLWLKDGKGRACPEVNVPHTIIISNGRPKVWYFTSGKEHCIKRKNRANITNATITEALAPRNKQNPNNTSSHGYSSSAGGTSAAATSAPGDPNTALLGAWGSTSYNQQQQASQQQLGGHRHNKSAEASVSVGRVPDGTSTGTSLGPWPHHGIVARFQGSMTMPHSTGGSPMRGASLARKKKGFELQDESVEFFTREQLGEILPPGHTVVHGVAALHEGVLQRFVQPRGQHHFSIRATWSPNACVVERRTSKAKLNDPRIALAERLAAWDGPTWLSDHTLINGTVLHGSVCRLCDNVASHLAEVSGGAVRVLRMVLFFCVDEANRIWLTHCGTLKTERLREHIMVTTGRFGAAAHLLGGPSRFLMRPGLSPPLLPSTAAAALRLRSPDGSRCISGGGASGGGALSGEASLDLPAPSAAFVASKSAAATDGSSEAAATAGRFLCVLTGEMYPGTQRCDVTYKQLLQHWFGLASQLPNEGDRLRAMDTIPLAIRRANPSLTREWYLRVRSQPTFLYRTAPVCLEAAAQITGMALDELQRTLMPSPSAMGAVAAAAAAAVGAAAAEKAGSQHHGGANVSNPGNGLLAGWAAAATQNHGSPPTTARSAMPEVVSRQNTTSMARVQLAAGPSVRQRPVTALPPAGPSGHLMPSQQATSFRSGSRLAPQQQSQQQSQPGAGPPRRYPMTRSKSASPSVAASRMALAPTSSGGVGGGGGGGGSLPSMLREKGGAAGAGLGKQPSFLQAYGPTPEQAAEAAAIAAALPYEVLDEARQLAAAEASEAAAAAAADAVETSSPRSTHRSHHGPHGDGHRGDEDGNDGGCGGDGGRGDDDSDCSEIDGTRPDVALAGQHVVAAPNSKMVHVSGGGGGGSGPGSPGRSLGPGPGYVTAATTSTHAGGGSGGSNYTAMRPIRVLPGRVSTSSELTEMGSVASFSDPSSPNAPHTTYHQQQPHPNPHAHVYAHGQTQNHGQPPSLGGGGGGSGGSPSSIPPSRMSPPRSAGAPTLHTIHEEGAVAAPLPPASPSKRACSPLGGPELHFPPPSRGSAGSHSVPRMRPNTRSGLDRQLAPGLGVSAGAAGRRHPGPTQMYGHGGGGATVAAAAGGAHGGLQRRNSFSENGDLPALPGAAAAAAAASLNSTMASSIGSLSRRSTSNQAVLSNEDMRTLRELSEAYSAAERLTQQLLAQAHEILSEDGSSRPGSTGNSPMHGGRRPSPSPRGLTPTSRPGTGNSGLTAAVTRQPSSNGSGTGGSARVSSGSGRPGSSTQRPSSSSLPPAPSPVPAAPSTSSSGLGPSPLGQREPYMGRSGSGRGLGHGVADSGGGTTATADRGLTTAAGPRALPPVQTSVGSQPRVAQGAVGVGLGEASGSSGGGGGSGGSLVAMGSPAHPATGNLDLLTSAEADLLAEALQD